MLVRIFECIENILLLPILVRKLAEKWFSAAKLLFFIKLLIFCIQLSNIFGKMLILCIPLSNIFW